jgi:hypothetical protein
MIPEGVVSEDPAVERATSKLETIYPVEEERLLPTALGNAIRVAEDRAGERYGFDTKVMLPRIFPVVSDKLGSTVTDLRDDLDRSANFSSVLLMAGLGSAVVLIPHRLWSLVSITLLLFSLVEYRVAVSAAVAYGRGLYVIFDLHRFDLLRALHRPLPETPAEEYQFNEYLSRELVNGMWGDDSLGKYSHGEPTSSLEPSSNLTRIVRSIKEMVHR